MPPLPSDTAASASRPRRAVPARPTGALRTSAAATAALATLATLASPAAAQPGAPAPDRWTLRADWLHAGAAPLVRDAAPGAGLVAGREFGDAARVAGGATWRVEAGWQRVARRPTTAKGATVALSRGFVVGRRADDLAGAGALPWLVVRPGVAAMVGRAESQAADPLYAWRGLPGTAWAGTSGTERVPVARRTGTVGAAATLALELPLTGGLALGGSLSGWRWNAAEVLGASRSLAVGGVGLVVRPRRGAHDARWWWRDWRRSDATVAPSSMGARR